MSVSSKTSTASRTTRARGGRRKTRQNTIPEEEEVSTPVAPTRNKMEELVKSLPRSRRASNRKTSSEPEPEPKVALPAPSTMPTIEEIDDFDEQKFRKLCAEYGVKVEAASLKPGTAARKSKMRKLKVKLAESEDVADSAPAKREIAEVEDDAAARIINPVERPPQRKTRRMTRNTSK